MSTNKSINPIYEATRGRPRGEQPYTRFGGQEMKCLNAALKTFLRRGLQGAGHGSPPRRSARIPIYGFHFFS